MKVEKIRVWFFAKFDEEGILEKCDFPGWREAEAWVAQNSSWVEMFMMRPIFVEKEETPV